MNKDDERTRGARINIVNYRRRSICHHRLITRLFSRLLQRRNPGKDDLDTRAAAGLGMEVEPAAQTIGYDTVDDMQAQPGASLTATRREKRIQRPAPDVETHAATIVGENDFDVVLAGFPHLNIDGAGLAVREGVRNRIEEQIG